jgi:hypothetical protein
VQQFFVPAASSAGPIGYVPVVIGSASVTISDARLGVDFARDVLYAAPVTADPVPLDWAAATRLDLTASDLLAEPEPGRTATFATPPPAALKAASYGGWEKAFARWVSRTEKLEVWRHPELKLVSRAGESEREFRIRTQVEGRAARDTAVDELGRKYAPKQAALAEKLRRAEAAVGREQEQASHQKLDTAVSIGATILGALLGRRKASAGTLGRATTTARGMRRTMKEASDVKRASETVDAVRERIKELEDQIAADAAAISARYQADVPLERVTLAPRRGQVHVHFVALGWLPR